VVGYAGKSKISGPILGEGYKNNLEKESIQNMYYSKYDHLIKKTNYKNHKWMAGNVLN